jgi:hypothetical protein
VICDDAPLLIAQRLETRALVANAVRAAFIRFLGSASLPELPLWTIEPLKRLDLICDVEAKLGVSFRDEDIEFLETPEDLVERGVAILAGCER